MVVLCRTAIVAAITMSLLISCLEGREESADQGRYRLADIEKLVLDRDPGVTSQIERINETRGELAEARSRYGPDFTAYYSRYPSGSNLPEEENVSHWLSVGLRQDIVDLFKVRPARIREKDAGVEGAEAALEEARAKALYELRRQYLDLLREDARIACYLNLTTLYESFFNIQNTRYVKQTALLPDLLEAQRQLIEAESVLRVNRNDLRRGEVLLAGSVGISPEELLLEQPDIPAHILSEEELVDLAFRNRGEIRQYDSRARMDMARASSVTFDDIRLSTFVGYRIRDDKLSSPASGLAISVTFSMPLRLRGIRNGRYDRFSARQGFWQSEAERTRWRIRREIHRAYSEYSTDKGRQEAVGRSIVLAEEQLRIERLKLDKPVQGVTSQPGAVLQAQADLAGRTLERDVLRCDVAEQFFELLYLAGLTLPSELDMEPAEIAMPRMQHEVARDDDISIESLEASWDDHLNELPPFSQFSAGNN